MSRPLVEAALAIAARGCPVFACNALKRPSTTNGYKDATRDPGTVSRMFSREGAVLIGVPTGAASGIVAIDIDSKDGKQGIAWLERRRVDLPNTAVHRTRSGGLHFLFQHPTGTRVPNSASQVHDGVDVRGDGGYIISPPSPGYAIAERRPLAPLPGWLLERVKEKPQEPPPAPRTPWDASSFAMEREAKRLAALLRMVETARVGERHNKAFWSACRIAEAEARGELPGDVAFAAFRDAAARAGLPVKESEDAIRDARARAYGSAGA